MRTVCQVLLSGSHPSLTFRAFARLKAQAQNEASVHFPKQFTTSRNMSYVTPEMASRLSPCSRTRSFPSARPTSVSPIVFSSEMNPCHDPQQVSIGFLADVPPTAGYEPKDLAEEDNLVQTVILPQRV